MAEYIWIDRFSGEEIKREPKGRGRTKKEATKDETTGNYIIKTDKDN